MSEFKAITTQEEFDKAIQDRLNRQKETLENQYKESSKKFADYEQLRTRNAELETQVGTLQKTVEDSKTSSANYDKQLKELNAKITGYETTSMRTKIALQHGLPYEFASRLIGEDENSIIEDAKKIAEFIGKSEPVPPLKDTEPNISGTDGAYKSLLENLNLEGE